VQKLDFDFLACPSSSFGSLDSMIDRAVKGMIHRREGDSDSKYWNRCNDAKYQLVEMFVEALPKICDTGRKDSFWIDHR